MNYEDISYAISAGTDRLGEDIAEAFFSYLRFCVEDTSKQFVPIYEQQIIVGDDLKKLGWKNPPQSFGKLSIEWLSHDCLTRIKWQFDDIPEVKGISSFLMDLEDEGIFDGRLLQYTHDFKSRYGAIRWAVRAGDKAQSLIHKYLCAPPKKEEELEMSEVEEVIPF